MVMTPFEYIVLRYLEVIDHRLQVIDHKLGSQPAGAPEIAVLTERLRAGTEALKSAIAPYYEGVTLSPDSSPSPLKGTTVNPILQALADQVAATTSAEASAVQLINGIAARIADAVAKAIAGGATAAELQPVTDEVNALKASAQALSDAIAANTPASATFKSKK